jgi:Cryptococcal mannosyltransferase 1
MPMMTCSAGLCIQIVVPCHTVMFAASTLHFSRRYGRLLVAANLRDSEALMPHLILQLVALLAHCPPHTVLLSVYESGSRDGTGQTAVNPAEALCADHEQGRQASADARLGTLKSCSAPVHSASLWPWTLVICTHR